MQPQPGDVVVQNKRGLDAFPGTDLEAQLKANGIETVVLAGFLTNCCVESTMRTAYEKVRSPTRTGRRTLSMPWGSCLSLDVESRGLPSPRQPASP